MDTQNNFYNTPPSPAVARLALLLALGIAVNLFELMIPRLPVFPWLKLGLANVFTLAVAVLYSPATAMAYAISRTLVSGVISGMPVTSFLFSGLGGIAAAGMMALAWHTLGKRWWSGMCGIAVLGAVCHNSVQLLVAYFLFVQNSAFLWQVPFLLFFSLGFGIIIGFLAVPVIRIFQEIDIRIPDSPVIRINFSWTRKIGTAALILFAASVLWADKWKWQALFGILLIGITLVSRIRVLDIAAGISRFWGLLAWTALANLFFTPGRYLLGPVTWEGLELAGLLSFRLALCVGASALYGKTCGMGYFHHLAGRVGGKQAMQIISLAMEMLPALGSLAKKMKGRLFTNFPLFVKEAAALYSGSETRLSK